MAAQKGAVGSPKQGPEEELGLGLTEASAAVTLTCAHTQASTEFVAGERSCVWRGQGRGGEGQGHVKRPTEGSAVRAEGRGSLGAARTNQHPFRGPAPLRPTTPILRILLTGTPRLRRA